MMAPRFPTGPVFEYRMHFKRGRRGRKQLRMRDGGTDEVPAGRVPRISRLMALALRFERLVREREVDDYAEIAMLGQVTRARMSQIMALLNLAPDIIEEILSLPLVEHGRDQVTERELRPITAVVDWRKQRRLWRGIRGA